MSQTNLIILGNLDQLIDSNLAAGQSLYDQPSWGFRWADPDRLNWYDFWKFLIDRSLKQLFILNFILWIMHFTRIINKNKFINSNDW